MNSPIGAMKLRGADKVYFLRRGILRHFSKMLKRGMTQRERLDTGQFFDVGFEEICRDPMVVVKSIYDFFGFFLSPEAEHRMCRYLEVRPRHLFGEHKYDQRDFGFSSESCHDLFSDYRRQYEKYLS